MVDPLWRGSIGEHVVMDPNMALWLGKGEGLIQ